MQSYSHDMYQSILNLNEVDLQEMALLLGHKRDPKKVYKQTTQRVTISQDGAIRRLSSLNDF